MAPKYAYYIHEVMQQAAQLHAAATSMEQVTLEQEIVEAMKAAVRFAPSRRSLHGNKLAGFLIKFEGATGGRVQEVYE